MQALVGRSMLFIGMTIQVSLMQIADYCTQGRVSHKLFGMLTQIADDWMALLSWLMIWMDQMTKIAFGLYQLTDNLCMQANET